MRQVQWDSEAHLLIPVQQHSDQLTVAPSLQQYGCYGRQPCLISRPSSSPYP